MTGDAGKPDVLIIGAGVAGLSLALRLSGVGRRVHVVAKGGLRDSSSYMAQGGIAVPLGSYEDVQGG